MPNYNDEIKNFVVGDSHDVIRTITGLSTSHPVVQAWLTVKINHADTDINAVVQKIITTTLGSGGQILDDGGASGKAMLLFQLTPSDTSLFVPLYVYNFDVQIKLDNGQISTPYIGTLVGKVQYTQSTS